MSAGVIYNTRKKNRSKLPISGDCFLSFLEGEIGQSSSPEMQKTFIVRKSGGLQSIAWAPKQKRALNLIWGGTKSSGYSRFVQSIKPNWLDVFSSKIDQLSGGEDFSAPNEAAKESARKILDALFSINLRPVSISPSSDEGVTFTFLSGSLMAALETYNSGETIAILTVKGEEPDVWEVQGENGLNDAAKRIRNHIAE
jgi:hypothetical protein